jgi:hypothetical protein
MLDMDRFHALGVIKNAAAYDDQKLDLFVETITAMRAQGKWSRMELVELFNRMLPEFNHKEMGRFLDGRM